MLTLEYRVLTGSQLKVASGDGCVMTGLVLSMVVVEELSTL